jgi:hypothetical protein
LQHIRSGPRPFSGPQTAGRRRRRA